jgi:hypothetical protein
MPGLQEKFVFMAQKNLFLIWKKKGSEKTAHVDNGCEYVHQSFELKYCDMHTKNYADCMICIFFF